MMLRYVDVSLTRPGLRHKVRLVTGKADFPSRNHDTIRLNCQGIMIMNHPRSRSGVGATAMTREIEWKLAA